jgi:hypothetical protein
MNEDEIDNELKCAVCQQPFHEPVSSTQCHHTFCKECIIACINQERRCPVCRTHSDYENYQPIKSRALLNQLNRLHVRCNACQIRNIQRVDFQGHTQKCPNWIIPCTAADIRCTWQGMRNRLANHVNSCPFQRIRPIVDDFNGQINRLQGQIQTHSQQIKDLQRQTLSRGKQIDDFRENLKRLLLAVFLVFAIIILFMFSNLQERKEPPSFGEKLRGLFDH